MQGVHVRTQAGRQRHVAQLPAGRLRVGRPLLGGAEVRHLHAGCQAAQQLQRAAGRQRNMQNCARQLPQRPAAQNPASMVIPILSPDPTKFKSVC